MTFLKQHPFIFLWLAAITISCVLNLFDINIRVNFRVIDSKDHKAKSYSYDLK